MNQKYAVISLLLFVAVSFVGLFAYDIKHGHKFEKLFGPQEPATNWKWEDDWGTRQPIVPQIQPAPQVVETPIAPQIIAGNYAEAIKKSGETGKPVLVFFTADWCQYCTKMKNETMRDSRVQAALRNYILVYVNSDANRTPVRKFGVQGLPSFVITNMNEDKLKFDSGFKNAPTFLAWLNNPSMYTQPRAMPRP